MGTGQALKDGRGTEYSTANESKLIGYFGRLNYSYKGKYMFAASLRHEGSTKFGADHKWGNFPSVSAAWNIKGEQFLEDTDVLSILKLRAGYGVTGTVPSDPYMSLNTLNFGTYVYYNNQWIKTIRPDSNANPELRWGKAKKRSTSVSTSVFGKIASQVISITTIAKQKICYGTMTCHLLLTCSPVW